jgi:hypothetical protein
VVGVRGYSDWRYKHHKYVSRIELFWQNVHTGSEKCTYRQRGHQQYATEGSIRNNNLVINEKIVQKRDDDGATEGGHPFCITRYRQGGALQHQQHRRPEKYLKIIEGEVL